MIQNLQGANLLDTVVSGALVALEQSLPKDACQGHRHGHFNSCCLGFHDSFFVASARLQTQRDAIEMIVQQGNLADREPISVALLERGEVTTSMGKFQSSRLRSMGNDLFDRQGKVVDAALISDVLLAPSFPSWSPVFLVERPTSPLAVTAILFDNNFPGAVAEFFYSVSLHHDHLRGHCVAFGESGISFRGICDHGNHRAFACIWPAHSTLIVLLGARAGWCAVAQTLVRESIRLRISVSFIAVVLIALPLLPLLLTGLARCVIRFKHSCRVPWISHMSAPHA